MTQTQTRRLPYAIEGPVREGRWGSVGFRLADPLAPKACRQAAAQLLHTFRLNWVPDLVDDVQTIVTELVANACQHAAGAYPAGSLTIWHPNVWLIIAVHDKNPHQPWRQLRRAREGLTSLEAEDGRGLAMVHALAQAHHGEVSFSSDGHYREEVNEHGRKVRKPLGKVTTVKMLMPNVVWPHTFYDPWRKRKITGRP
ncbi:ATP-binding protein [Streptomyces fumanus]|uniref:ATP-binding protein n=1 Tax=Streptomyces fumanus TaxID=67302 RepID=UPI0033D9C618